LIPDAIKNETKAAFNTFRGQCTTDSAENPVSVGDYLTEMFRNWLKTKVKKWDLNWL
jgi:hypothetical protein